MRQKRQNFHLTDNPPAGEGKKDNRDINCATRRFPAPVKSGTRMRFFVKNAASGVLNVEARRSIILVGSSGEGKHEPKPSNYCVFFSLISLHTPFPLPLLSALLVGTVVHICLMALGISVKRGISGTQRSVSSKGREESRCLIARVGVIRAAHCGCGYLLLPTFHLHIIYAHIFCQQPRSGVIRTGHLFQGSEASSLKRNKLTCLRRRREAGEEIAVVGEERGAHK